MLMIKKYLKKYVEKDISLQKKYKIVDGQQNSIKMKYQKTAEETSNFIGIKNCNRLAKVLRKLQNLIGDLRLTC